MTDIEKELKKVKFHLGWILDEIGELNERDTPISWLITERDWDEDDLQKAHDIFEKYDNALQNGADVDWGDFEAELYKTLYIGYPAVKSIILVFFRADKWGNVCRQYAGARAYSEFDEIRDIESV